MSHDSFDDALRGVGNASIAVRALAYADLGWLVLPLFEIAEDGRCACDDHACRSPGKHPRIFGSYQKASSDPQIITEWWRKWPQANIGVIRRVSTRLIAASRRRRSGSLAAGEGR